MASEQTTESNAQPTPVIEEASEPQPPAPDPLEALGEFKFFNPPHSSGSIASTSTAEIPSNFFDLSGSDLKRAQASLAARTRELQESPLMTQKMRDQMNAERRKRWPTVTIRVKFASRAQLEKTFSSSDRIRSVYAFVRASLREDAVPHKFVLYQTPPRRDLRVSDPLVKDKSLLDLQLAPSAILMFRFLEDDVTLDLPDQMPPLLTEILSNAQELPMPVPEATPGPTVDKSKPTIRESSSKGDSVGGKAFPKWFKIGQNKNK